MWPNGFREDFFSWPISFLLAIVLSVLRCMPSDGHVGTCIFIFFLLVMPEHFALQGTTSNRSAYGRHISHTIGMEYGNVVQDIPYIIPTK
jgi:hypothetical protein